MLVLVPMLLVLVLVQILVLVLAPVHWYWHTGAGPGTGTDTCTGTAKTKFFEKSISRIGFRIVRLTSRDHQSPYKFTVKSMGIINKSIDDLKKTRIKENVLLKLDIGTPVNNLQWMMMAGGEFLLFTTISYYLLLFITY